jgi:hypothetical protein
MRANRPFFNQSPFFIRLRHWEYWPFNLVYAPVAVYMVWLMFRSRSCFFFSASNPTIETGGMFGEAKWDIFKLMPQNLYPATILVAQNASPEAVQKQMQQAKMHYPVIAKPNRGERGWLVGKIWNDAQLAAYLQQVKAEFLIQTCVNLPVEMSVFYYRYPNCQKGIISSLTIKEMLQVTGNGQSTLLQLIQSYPRAVLQLPVLRAEWKDALNNVPEKGEIIELVPFGNHSRGSKFLDACYLIDEPLTNVFNEISQKIDGFYFGRYDIRCESVEALKAGKNFQILELNGAGAEPAHIYQPGFSLLKAYRVLFHHFNVLRQISAINHKNGTPYMSWKQFVRMRRLVKNYRAQIQINKPIAFNKPN